MESNSMKIRVILNLKVYKFKANPSAKLYHNSSLMEADILYTYLDHIINNNVDDNKDIERQLQKIGGNSTML